jgi:hypothetical protein
MVDVIVDRRAMKLLIARLLRHMMALPAPDDLNGNGEE